MKNALALLALALVTLLLVGCGQTCPESEPSASLSFIEMGGEFSRVWDFALTDDSGGLMAGSTDANPDSRLDFDIDAVIVRADASGQIQWTRFWDFGLHDEWTSVLPSSDGGYYLAGVTGSEITRPGHVLGRTDMILAKVDEAGNEVWSKELRAGRDVAVWALCVNSDDTFVIAGSERDEGDSASALLAKFDTEGNEVWRRLFARSIALGVIVARDGGYVLCGQTEDRYLSVIKTDPEGVFQWEFTSKDVPTLQPHVMTGHDLVETRDGGYAVVCDVVDAMGESLLYVVKLDSSVLFEWVSSGLGAPYGNGYALHEAPDESLIAGGLAYSRRPILERFTTCRRFYGVRLREDGSVVWSARLGDFDADAYSMRLSSAGQVVFAGTRPLGGGTVYFLTTNAGG